MAYFDDLNVGLNVALGRILSSQDLCKLLYYNNKNPLGQSDISDTSILLMNNIFPLPKDPNSIEEKKGILGVYFYEIKPQRKNTGFQNTVLCFDVMCHLDIWNINDGSRPLSILSQIDRLFNDQRIKELSINRCFREGCYVNKYSDYYYGYKLIYKLGQDSNTGCLN